MKIKYLFFLFVFPLYNVFCANELYASQSYCFKQSTKLKNVQAYLRPILLANEKLYLDHNRNCFELSLSKYRKELFDKFLMMKYQGQLKNNRVDGSDYLRENCRIELLRKSKSKSNSNKMDISSKRLIRAKNNNRTMSQTSRSTLLIGNKRPSIVNIYNQHIYITCEKRRDNNYFLDISLSSKSKMSITTSLNVSLGQQINIGSVTEELKNKEQGLSINNGFQYNKISGNNRSDFFITILH